MDLDLIYDAFAKLNILDLLYDKSEKVQEAYAKWCANRGGPGGAKNFDKIWPWIKKNDSVNALTLYIGTLKFKTLPWLRLPGIPENHYVIRIPRGQKFDRDNGEYGIGTKLQAMLGDERVSVLIEPGFRADGVLRLVTLNNIANK